MRRVALATCAEVPALDEDERTVLEPLARLGIDAGPAVWDDRHVDWSEFDLVVVRSTWDYAERREDFLAWAERVPRLRNALDVLRWNTDKRYLRELAAAGVAVVPTEFLEPGDRFEPPRGRFVVKPAVSAGSRSTASYEEHEHEVAAAHVAELLAAGRTVMVQPYLEGVDEAGETALLYIGGRFSHAVRKGALLRPGQPPGDVLFLEEQLEAREPAADEVAAAEAVLAALPFRAELLYARVDLLPSAAGPLLLELELAEPSLFLRFGDGAAERLADAIAQQIL